MIKNKIAIQYNPQLNYSEEIPYSPSEKYPEYKFSHLSIKNNLVYGHIRTLLIDLDLDKEHVGTSDWNPFGEMVKPNSKVVIKPNWVRDFNPVEADITGLITHTSILRAIIDYTLIALKGSGTIIIGDAPIQSTDFDLLQKKLNTQELLSFYHNKTTTKIQIKDFRREIKTYDKRGAIVRHQWIEKHDSIEINLKNRSFLHPIRQQFKKFRVTNYDPKKMFRYHNLTDNIFVIDRDILTADLVIQLPKFKTHRKAGITCCMKNSIGINCQKDALVHHRKGSLITGGDAYPNFNLLKSINENLYEFREQTVSQTLQKSYSKLIGINSGILRRLKCNRFFEGSWHGNDTLWRTILDLTNILFNYDHSGMQTEANPRKVFYLVDAVIGGDKEGPLEPKNKFAGFLAAGWNPILIDSACASLAGLDYIKIKVIQKALENNLLDVNLTSVELSEIVYNGKISLIKDLPTVTRYEPSKGWKNKIEKR